MGKERMHGHGIVLKKAYRQRNQNDISLQAERIYSLWHKK
jgi:hypothetical protein